MVVTSHKIQFGHTQHYNIKRHIYRYNEWAVVCRSKVVDFTDRVGDDVTQGTVWSHTTISKKSLMSVKRMVTE